MPAVPLFSSADSGSLLRSVGMRGGRFSPPTAPHPLPVLTARLQARRQVLVALCLPGFGAEEIQLSKASVSHVLQMTEESGCDAPQFRVSGATRAGRYCI